MKTPKLLNIGLFIILLLLAGTSKSVNACECLAPKDKKIFLGHSDAAFIGKVAKIEYLNDFDGNGKGKVKGNRVIITFEVYRVFKGEPKKKIVIQQVSRVISCRYKFEKDKQYLVFAQNNALQTNEKSPKSVQSLGVDLCSGTKELSEATNEMKELGEGKIPQ